MICQICHRKKFLIHPLKTCGLYYLIGLILILGIKYYYRHADVQDLTWILAPTARWVQILSGISFTYDMQLGYVSHSLRFIIAPSCCGVQFLLIAFATLLYSFLHRMRSMQARIGWMSFCITGAYLFTIFINGIRIVLSIYFPQLLTRYLQWNGSDGRLTSDTLHTMIGTVIYFASLLLLYHTTEKVSRRISAVSELKAGAHTCHSMLHRSYLQAMFRYLPPTFFYFCIVLGIPLLHRAYRNKLEGFLKYALFITVVCLTVLFFFCLFAVMRTRLQHNKH